MTAVRLGVIGTGRIGRVHVETLTRHVANAQVITVTDLNQDAARDAAAQFGVGHVSASADEVLHDPNIDAVVICTATDTHANLIMRAAQAGKHIFCEKPIAADLAHIDTALAAVNQAGVKLMLGFNRRFDPNHARIKYAIESGEIGTPHQLTIISRDPAPPPISYVKVSGGMFFDMTIHDFDMARFLFGEVESVYALGGVLVDPEIGAAGDIDTAIITLRFVSGAQGVIENSRKAVYGYDQRVEAFGSAGSASSGNWYADAVTISSADSVRRGLPLNFFMDRYLASYQAELAAFVRCLIDDTPPPVTGLDGRAPVVIAQAAVRSMHEGRAIRLNEIA